MKCYGCGIDKDLSKDEVYPYPEEDRLTTDPVPPLFVFECQSEAREPEGGSCYRAVVVCHECFHKLDPDMWIGEASCWRPLNPVVPFEKLPEVISRNWNPSSYPDLA